MPIRMALYSMNLKVCIVSFRVWPKGVQNDVAGKVPEDSIT